MRYLNEVMEKSEHSFWSKLAGACWRWIPALLILGSCKDKYNAPVRNPPTGYLVIEGFINVGGDSTKFTLSRTTGLDSPYIIPENGAAVSVQSGNGDEYPLAETGGGHYVLGTWPVDLSQQYRIQVKTANGKQYQSDLSEAKVAPPIDSLTWKPVDGGVNLYVTTHDPSKKSIYYQWDFQETWEYMTPYVSNLIYLGRGEFTTRPDAFEHNTCYMSDLSTSILLGSTAGLSDDVMYERKIGFVPYQGLNKLSRRYSVLVKQHVLTKDWYEWNQQVLKNTEQLGSIFDPQPSEVGGNIHNISDPAEPVIGYIGCSTETQKRLFIDRGQLPPHTAISSGYEECMMDTVANNPDSLDLAFGSGNNYLPLDPVFKDGALIGYSGGTVYCVDCRLYGGVTTKPDFW